MDLKLAGGGMDINASAIPGATNENIPGIFVQAGGSVAVAGGAGAELVIVPTDTGALAGWSVSAAAGKVATEAHLTMTYSRVYYLGSY